MLVAIASFSTFVALMILVLFKEKPKSATVQTPEN